MTTSIGSAPASDVPASRTVRPSRITSIDALRGLVMFAMIYVNDIAAAGTETVPRWMRHFSKAGSGMTFVDLIFPGFLFIVGMSIPFALGSRLAKGERIGKLLLHIVIRTLSLLFIGILMVDESPDSGRMGWSGDLWSTLLFVSAILAFCSLSAPRGSEPSASRERALRILSAILRVVGFACLVFLAFTFRGKDGHRIITLSPFSIHTEWYGILGLIGWAYLTASIVFLLFRDNRTALLGATVLLFCLYPADETGAFDKFWLNDYVQIGTTFGAIATAGLLLASILLAADTAAVRSRVAFTLWFAAACSIAALLLNRLYGISKEEATPSWCLWACATTSTLWLMLYFLCDVRRVSFVAKPLSLAGENVLLAYLLSNLLYPAVALLHLGPWYLGLSGPDRAQAIARAIGCAVAIISLSIGLTRAGLRLKL
jgi:heparan-alpha-glucosaminide N-acetyltransferase